MFALTTFFSMTLATVSFAVPMMFGSSNVKGGVNSYVTQRPVTQKPITYPTYPTKGAIKAVTKDPCIGKEYAPDPNNCNKFFQCVGGKMLPLPCPRGLYWNQRKTLCDWPSNVNRPECPAPATAGCSETNAKGFTCPKRSGLFAVEGDCNSFYMCDHCKATQKRCPSGLAWNQKLTVCDWPSRVKGCKPDANSQHTQKPIPPVTQATVRPTRGNIKGNSGNGASWGNLGLGNAGYNGVANGNYNNLNNRGFHWNQ